MARRAITSQKYVKEVDEAHSMSEFHLDLLLKLVEAKIISSDQVINYDETMVLFNTLRRTTLARRGSKAVIITNDDQKGGITALIAATASGKLLKTQLIFSGTTARSLPSIQDPNLVYSQSQQPYWSSSIKCLSLIKRKKTLIHS